MEQKRLFLAFILSAVILFGWTYFFAPKRAEPGDVNPTQNATSLDPSTTSVEAIPSSAPLLPQSQTVLTSSDNIPRRSITIVSPLYRVQLDTLGAVATSWIITRNKESGREFYSMASGKNNKQQLELIPSELIRKSVPETPFPLQLVTGDGSVDHYLASRNYSVSGVDDQFGDVQLQVQPNEVKTLAFVLRDEATGLEATKTLKFTGDSYIVDVGVGFARDGQFAPKVSIAIGPSIGDQGVPEYSFYAIAPEAVFDVNGSTSIYTGQKIHEDKDLQTIAGPVNWVGVGDTYFAMAAVPTNFTQSAELRAQKYAYESDSIKEDRYLVTAYLPVSADGTVTKVYVGPKDHNLLTTASGELGGALNRQVDLESLINYGWLGRFVRPLAGPIFWSLRHLHKLTGSYGTAIILFTIVIYSLFFPLKWRSSKSMKKAQKHAPRMKEIQEKMKGLKQTDSRLKELQMEQLRLMKEANPLGGCLPLLIQMPFIIALYTVITVSIDFRQSSFLWMPDLSAADPYRLLPVLMAVSMVVLQFITPAPSADPLQRKMMAVVLPAVMLYMLWTAPAGLLVYWFVGNIVGFVQQLIINRLVKSDDNGELQPPTQKAKLSNPKKLSEARVV